ncbi:hypothetical protein B0H11DRAFT_1920770 [Mycena galericulata]|nr:hypothetical protein B0H11DRAFT_1920770 [Mycena galericulata]
MTPHCSLSPTASLVLDWPVKVLFFLSVISRAKRGKRDLRDLRMWTQVRNIRKKTGGSPVGCSRNTTARKDFAEAVHVPDGTRVTGSGPEGGTGEAPDEVEGIRPERASAGNRTTGVKNNKDKQDPEVSRRHRDEDGTDTGTTVGNVRRAGGPIGSERNRRRSHGNELRGLELVKRSNGWPTDPLRERAGGPAAGAGPEAWEQVLARPASM